MQKISAAVTAISSVAIAVAACSIAFGHKAPTLDKRGGEAHSPDRMQINRQQVLLIEPVKTDSQIAKLIAEQNAAH